MMLDIDNHKSAYLCSLLSELIKSDGNVDKNENQALQSISSSLEIDISRIGNINECYVELTPLEQSFFLREMFRFSTLDLNLCENEKKIISEFRSKHAVSDKIYEAVSRWASKNLQNEKEYFSFIETLNK